VIDLDPMRELSDLAATAGGEAVADVYVRGARILNVYSREILPGNVAIKGERVAYVGERESMVGEATEVIDATGCVLCPGFVEPHSHPWVVYNPVTFAEACLERGVTTVFADDLLLFEQLGPEGFLDVAAALSRLPLKYFWIVRGHSQTRLERERGLYDPQILERLLRNDHVRAVGELTRWNDVFRGDAVTLEALVAAKATDRRIEGHTAGASYEKLNALAAVGVSSCHESITSREVLDRLRLGLCVMLRYSSLRPDLPELLPELVERAGFLPRLMLTTDGSSPSFIAREGLLDGCLRLAMDAGCDPRDAYRMATLNPATYFRMDHEIGGIAPGRYADINVLADVADPRPRVVMARGRVVARDGALVEPLPETGWDRRFPQPWLTGGWRLAARDLVTSPNDVDVPVVRLESAAITRLESTLRLRGGGAESLPLGDGSLACLISRDGGRISRILLKDALPRLDGLATTYNNAWEILTLGRDPGATAVAVARLLEIGGGIVAVHRGRIAYELPLPLGGSMSRDPVASLAGRLEELAVLFRACGYIHREPLYTLFFLCGDFLPEVRLTPCGVWSVKERRILVPTARLASVSP
jgi:adenine deaminase